MKWQETVTKEQDLECRYNMYFLNKSNDLINSFHSMDLLTYLKKKKMKTQCGEISLAQSQTCAD